MEANYTRQSLFNAGLSIIAVGAVACGAERALPAVTVHTHASSQAGIFANAYLVETDSAVVAIDATLSVSESRALRAELDALGKPLAGVLLTHGHPDHYNGVTTLIEGTGAPVIALAGVDEIIRRDDAAKAEQWTPVFGPEWPAKRTFPTQLAEAGEPVELAGVRFVAKDLGPAESHHDSIWMIDAADGQHVFVGDQVLHQVHAYVSDGHTAEWLESLEDLAGELPSTAKLYPGHGSSGGTELLAWQRGYLEAYRSAVRALASGQPQLSAEAKQSLTEEMKRVLPTNKLEFLIALGADAVAAELARQ